MVDHIRSWSRLKEFRGISFSCPPFLYCLWMWMIFRSLLIQKHKYNWCRFFFCPFFFFPEWCICMFYCCCWKLKEEDIEQQEYIRREGGSNQTKTVFPTNIIFFEQNKKEHSCHLIIYVVTFGMGYPLILISIWTISKRNRKRYDISLFTSHRLIVWLMCICEYIERHTNLDSRKISLVHSFMQVAKDLQLVKKKLCFNGMEKRINPIK